MNLVAGFGGCEEDARPSNPLGARESEAALSGACAARHQDDGSAACHVAAKRTSASVSATSPAPPRTSPVTPPKRERARPRKAAAEIATAEHTTTPRAPARTTATPSAVAVATAV